MNLVRILHEFETNVQVCLLQVNNVNIFLHNHKWLETINRFDCVFQVKLDEPLV